MKEAAYTIRHAKATESEPIIRVIHRVYDEYGFIFDAPTEVPDLLDLATHYDGFSGVFYVCCADNEIVGTIGININGEKIAEIHRLYLLPAYRGHGLGRVLLLTAIDWARSKKACQIMLWSDTRFTTAHSLYKTFGFAQTAGYRELGDINHSAEFQFTLPL
jgi:putative acetyltransferase